MKRSSWMDYTKRKAIKLNCDQKGAGIYMFKSQFMCSKSNITGEYSWRVLLVVKSTASLRVCVSVRYNAFTLHMLSLSAPIVGTLLGPFPEWVSLKPSSWWVSSVQYQYHTQHQIWIHCSHFRWICQRRFMASSSLQLLCMQLEMEKSG